MSIFQYTYREFLILFYISLASIFTNGYVGDRIFHDMYDGIPLSPWMSGIFVLMTSFSCLVLVLAFLDFRPKAKIAMAKTYIVGPIAFVIGLVAFLSFFVTVLTFFGSMWVFVRHFY